MALGHLGQFDEFHCDSRTHKVLSNYISTLGVFPCPWVVHCVWSFQVHMFNSTPADISRFWSILFILEPYAFSVFLLCHPFGGRDSLKKNQKFTKRCVTWLMYVYDMTHPILAILILTKAMSDMSYDSMRYMCGMTHSNVWHDSFMCDRWLIDMCNMTHL